MKVVFVSNYYNHHQAPFSEIMASYPDVDYSFIATEPMERERISMGWNAEEKPPFVYYSYDIKEQKKCNELVLSADIVIFGDAPYEMKKKRFQTGKVTFIYTERWYKRGFQNWKRPIRFFRLHSAYGKYNNLYLLCASAYTSYDCARVGLFRNKAYKWGYFPELKQYGSIDEVLENKQPSSIIWVARLIDLKHPEVPIEVAKRLRESGYRFSMRIIGTGALEEKVKKKISEYGLEECVQLLGSMKPEQVRTYMEQSEIFLFSSDFNEGWGAVLNESMNSACAVVASHAIGSVPFLLRNGENGIIYENGAIEDCFKKVRFLLDNPEIRKAHGRNAYGTLYDTWNAKVASERLIKLSEALLNGRKSPDLFNNGPCSKAEIIKNNWFCGRKKINKINRE